MNIKKSIHCLFYSVIPLIINANQPVAEQAFSKYERFEICFILPNQKRLRLPVHISPEAYVKDLYKMIANKADLWNLFKKNRVWPEDICIAYDQAVQSPLDSTQTVESIKKQHSILYCALKK